MKKYLLFRAWTRFKRSSLLLLLVLFCAPIVSAQIVPLSGTVSDAQGVLPGVTVQIKNKLATTTTDANGVFKITALPDDTVVFSYVGYLTVEVLVDAQNTFNITLKEDATALEEVLVNAGYYKVKDKERTGSIAKITSKDIETQPVTNVLATMQGRMAGVDVVQQTGVPGGGFTVRIRGINSLRNEGNQPLYVIDGVPYSSDPIGYSQTSSLLFSTPTSPLNSINPDAVESIEVLKDADATAIYGSRGANGVVLITTKKGKTGKTQYQFSATTGTGKATAFMDLMNTEQYLNMRKKAYANDGIDTYPANAYDVNGTWDQERYTDWQKELLGGTASISTFQGTITGGTAETQFLIGGNYHTQGSVYPGSFVYNKSGGNLNLQHASTDQKFRLTLSSNTSIQDNDQPGVDLTFDARKLAPNAPDLYDENGDLNWENNTFANPLAGLNSVFKSRTDDWVNNIVLSYQITPKWQAKSSFGYTSTNHKETRTTPSTIYNPSLGITSESSSLFVTNSSRRSWIVEPQINYATPLLNGKLEVLLGSTFQQQNATMISQMGTGFTSNGLIDNLNAAATVAVFTDEEIIYKYQAFFGRMNYNWQQKYLLNLTARRDGSSRFGPGNQFALFGAAGAAWIFSNESFFKQLPLLSFGKLRGSFGTTGSDQIGDYQFLDTYKSATTQYQNVVGLQPSRLYNPSFGWETNQKLEVALELGFLKDRVFLTTAFFRNRSSNQLVGIPIPGTTGFTTMQANLDATVENKGYEITLRSVNIDAGKWKWTTDFNIAVLKNKLLSFPNLEASSFSQRYRVGQPINISLVYNNTGVDPNTGIYTFEDMNGDGQITFPEDRQKVVDLNPAYFGGIQNQLKYRNWTLDVLFQFVKQRSKNISYGAPGRRNFNQPLRFLNSWRQVGDQRPYQMYTSGTNTEAMNAQTLYENSDAMIVDASFIRLKNISISYNVPLSYKNVSCKLFMEAQNLLTFTKYQDGDPEFTATGFMPPLKIINTGFTIQF